MKKLSRVLEGLGSQVKQHQWKLVHRSTARWEQKECVLVCRLMSVHTFTCMWNSGFSPCLPPSPSPPHFPLRLFSFHSFLSSPCLSLLSSVLVFPLLPSSSSSISPLPSSPLLPHLLPSLLSSSPPTQHHSAEVLKWEESKRWQKRLEGLRTKLTEKNRELEAAQRQIKALKETLARCVS